MSKRVLVLLLVVTVCLVSIIGSSFAAPKNMKFAFILKTLSNPYWVAMREGAIEEGKKLGIQVNVYAVPTEGDIKAQADLIENVIQKRYHGIAVAPLTPVNLIPGIVRANGRKIPVVNLDEKVDEAELAKQKGSLVSIIFTDNYKVGATAANLVIERLGTTGGKVAIIEGMSGNATGNARRDGFRDTITKEKQFELVASQPGNWDRITALNVATNMLQRFPDLVAIYCANDTMALGAAQAIINANKLGKIMVIGTDGIPEAITGVQEGRITATVAQDPTECGKMGVRALNDFLNKKKVDKYQDVPSKLIVK